MKQLKSILAITLVFCMLFTSSSGFAYGAKSENFEKHTLSLEEVADSLRKEGASEEVVKRLIDKLERGEVWDSMNPKYNDLQPQIQTDTYSKTTYPDGSMIIYRIQEVQPKIQTRSVHNIKKYKVQLNGFRLTMSFCIDARRDPSKNLAIIDSQYNKEVRVFAGSFTEDTYGFIEGWKNHTNAWYAIYYTAPGVMGSKRFWCKAHVSGSRIWQEASTL